MQNSVSLISKLPSSEVSIYAMAVGTLGIILCMTLATIRQNNAFSLGKTILTKGMLLFQS